MINMWRTRSDEFKFPITPKPQKRRKSPRSKVSQGLNGEMIRIVRKFVKSHIDNRELYELFEHPSVLIERLKPDFNKGEYEEKSEAVREGKLEIIKRILDPLEVDSEHVRIITNKMEFDDRKEYPGIRIVSCVYIVHSYPIEDFVNRLLEIVPVEGLIVMHNHQVGDNFEKLARLDHILYETLAKDISYAEAKRAWRFFPHEFDTILAAMEENGFKLVKKTEPVNTRYPGVYNAVFKRL